MSRVRVVIATTSGPVEVRRITPEHSDVDSAACVEHTDAELPISAAYNSFVRPPTGILQRHFEHDSYLLELSARIDVGDSWKLGVFAAHALHYADRLAVGGEDADLVVWLTGEVQRDLGVPTTGHVDEKLRRSEALFAALARRGTPYRLYLPADNAAALDEKRLAEIGVAPEAVVAVAEAGDLLRDLGLPAANTKSPVRQKGNRRLIGLAASAMILIAVVGAVVAWPEPDRAPPVPRSGPADPLEAAFESNLSAEKISSLLSDRTILGTSVVTDTTFVMNLDGDGKATVALKLPGNSAVMHDEGTWWVEKGKYCYRFSRFGKGLVRCRFVYEEQGRIKIMFLSGRPSDWRVTPRKMSERSAGEVPRQSR